MTMALNYHLYLIEWDIAASEHNMCRLAASPICQRPSGTILPPQQHAKHSARHEPLRPRIDVMQQAMTHGSASSSASSDLVAHGVRR